ncbi:hypothetical protein [Bacillus sp. ISL-37]|uniref:hypothetical protein n=1 Tax=Bacillus sp. ISL-37 TaxID=2819123 RepID=UPI001BE911F7|nr:hypothetical protein [Bacillus sp. ISL-37]MBT2684659.1 hypothetical protein [Bacillus sp. ISL-37]
MELTVIPENNVAESLFACLLSIVDEIDQLYGQKESIEDIGQQEELITYATRAFSIKQNIKKAIEEEIQVNIESIDEIEEIVEKVKGIFEDFLKPLNGKEILIFAIYKTILLREDVLGSYHSFSNLEYKDIDYIDSNGFIQPEVNGDYSELIVCLPPVHSKDEMNQFLEGLNISILYALLSAIDLTGMPESDNIVLLGEKAKVEKNQLVSYIKLKKISEGAILHNNHFYGKDIAIGTNITWDINNPYQQFDEIMLVLSEYNQQKQILDKYLKIYQVLENFKYRSKIATLIDEYGEKMFSIRRFTSLYSMIESSESDELKKLIGSILSFQISPTLTFQQLLESEWNTFKSTPGMRISDLKKELVVIGCKTDPAISSKFLSSIIYSLRNSIAHNKETEVHLTHGNLGDFPLLKEFIKEFLMPTLEKIVFTLLIEKNELIWYKRPHLLLFK